MVELPSFLNQTKTQDSSLTHIYDHSGYAAYFSDPQDLNAFAGFQAFSANSISEVDDFASIGEVQPGCNQFGSDSIEFYANELVFSDCCDNTTRTFSRGVVAQSSSEKAIIAADSDSTNGQRTSIYRGVTRQRTTGKYEAHLWDKSIRREGKARKGRQIYLGAYEKEEKAARAYDLAALKYLGPTATTNFLVSNYTKELEEMKAVTRKDFIASLRRKSSGFSRGGSKYRGVIARHDQKGRWQAKIGCVAIKKDLYLGTFETEEEAAEAYDIATIKFRGANAVTNFEINRYDVEAIINSSLPLPMGGAAKRLKQKPPPISSIQQQRENLSSSIIHQPIPFDSYYDHNLFHHFQYPTNAGTTESSTIATGLTALPAAAPDESFIWPPPHSY